MALILITRSIFKQESKSNDTILVCIESLGSYIYVEYWGYYFYNKIQIYIFVDIL